MEKGKYTIIRLGSNSLNDLDTCARVLKIINKHLEKERVFLALDFAEVTYMNSTFIAILANTHNRVRRQQGVLALFNLNANVRNLMVITNLNRVFTLVEKQEDLETL
jgi:anti-sigma B factor antagonist